MSRAVIGRRESSAQSATRCPRVIGDAACGVARQRRPMPSGGGFAVYCRWLRMGCAVGLFAARRSPRSSLLNGTCHWSNQESPRVPAQPTTRHSRRAVITARGGARQRRLMPWKGAAKCPAVAASVVYVGESIRSRGRQMREQLIFVAILGGAAKILSPSSAEV